jgi:nitroimidazol reductase NimA-like FMN-containing flavoprotein (pyridoxamine 5'-phosphate oxidase superfamily)
MTNRGLEILDATESRAKLASMSLGRISLRIGATPTILPVNFVMLDDDIVFRTDPGSKLSAALMGLQVAFEVDDVARDDAPAWSVVVVGYAEEVRDATTLARVDELGLEPWASGAPRGRVVRIAPRQISGRAVV